MIVKIFCFIFLQKLLNKNEDSKVSDTAGDTEQPGEAELPVLPSLPGVYIIHLAKI